MKDILGDNITLYYQDAMKILPLLSNESINVIATDPPYFLSNGGITCKNGTMSSVDKGEWDKTDISMEEFYNSYLREFDRILKPDGTIWLFGTMHNIYTLGYLLKKNNYKILNNIIWQKTNPAPNLSCRMFTHSTETILWAKKDNNTKHYFNYKLMKELNNGKQMKDVWKTSTVKKSEKQFGYHPTQKPLEIMERIILSSSKEQDIILDCFMGSGTTVESAIIHNRKAIGIESDAEYYNIAKQRIINRMNNTQLTLY
ncbi:site-specific DNA-methyltransferase (adenine-specific) [Ignavigranum ruoffiae]|uniref:Methyltransferase n=1 Tax=Ignavigranum ruoffiae TaxID=89093 RepID=A0A1H9B474_9LACT|nr:site-specific DNA-methyltransferase [Ignavigranum ruoffiae]SEP83840.1 site-specific DNA-methyltransferase (adenine-specific) [Ignavigranum ruoffiae]